MKNIYEKPQVEYVSFQPQEDLLAEGGVNPSVGGSGGVDELPFSLKEIGGTD